MDDSCKLRFLAPNWTWFLPTSSWRRDKSVLLTFGSGDGRRRAADGSAVRAKLGIGVGGLRCFSSDGNTFCGRGEARGISYVGQLGAGGGTIAEHQMQPCLSSRWLRLTVNDHWGGSIYRGKEGEDCLCARESIPNGFVGDWAWFHLWVGFGVGGKLPSLVLELSCGERTRA
jgi:hypothetical protein